MVTAVVHCATGGRPSHAAAELGDRSVALVAGSAESDSEVCRADGGAGVQVKVEVVLGESAGVGRATLMTPIC